MQKRALDNPEKRPGAYFSWGLELSGARDLLFLTGTTATAATIVPAGNKLGLTPQNAFSAWNRFNLEGGWGLGLGLIRQSSMFATLSNAVTLPAFTRVDGAVYYAINPRTRLAFNVENLGNTKYYPTADADNNITVGAPINARMTLSLAF